tara:strand:+ start:2842 stop:3939 length:1098 start_codon:yes stop_codon:yes gene_type:complete
MSYGRMNQPKFYIDAGLLGYTLALIDLSQSNGETLFQLNPWSSNEFIVTAQGIAEFNLNYGSVDDKVESGKIIPSLSWFGVFGIKEKNSDDPDLDLSLFLRSFTNGDNANISESNYLDMLTDLNNIYGTDSGFSQTLPLKAGYALCTFNNPWINDPNTSNVGIQFGFTSSLGGVFEIGSLSFGWDYTPGVSPDMELTESYSNDGVKNIRTIGGKDFTQINHRGRPSWLQGGLMPFQSNPRTASVKNQFVGTYLNSRKKWSMSFSYIDDTKLKPELDFENATDTGSAPFDFIPFGQGMNIGHYDKIQDNFISKVWYGTMNGVLPFVFQPNQDVEEFHIVKFVDKTISFNQVAHNTYNVAFELEEVW